MHSTIAAMYPRMRTGIFFTPTPEGDGVLLTNGSEVVSFQGASTYAWLERLSPHLDGRHSVSELTGSLPPGPRTMVERLIGALHEAGLVRDVGEDRPHELTDRELDAYAAEIAFVEAFRDSPALRFQRYRRARLVLIGAGEVFAAAAEGALATGVAALSARYLVGEEQGDGALRAHLHRLAAEAEQREPGQRLEARPLDPADPVALREAAEAAELVLYAADHADPDRLRSLDRVCADLGRTLIPVTVRGDEAWIGPVCGAEGQPGVRWESLWLRLGAPAAAEPTAFLTGPVPGIIANHLVFRAFEYLTGVAEAGAAGVVRLDLETLQTSSHTLAPHPALGPAADGRPADGVVDAEELVERVVPLTDERLGVLGPVTEGRLEQFPLRVVRVDVADPHRPGAPFAVWGAGPDFPRAQDAALRHALAAHAVRLTVGASGDGAEPVPGIALADGGERPVPAGQVFAAAPDGAPPVGTAGAASWAAAVEQGLLDHLLRDPRVAPRRERWEMPDAAPGDHPAALESLELTSTAQQFLDLLVATGEPLAVSAVAGPAGARVYAARLGAHPAERGAGFTAAEAVESALGRLLLAHQARTAGQPEYAPAPSVVLRTAPTAPVAPTDGTRHGTLVAALRAAGLEPVAVPLHQDAAVRAALPHLVRVVLLDA